MPGLRNSRIEKTQQRGRVMIDQSELLPWLRRLAQDPATIAEYLEVCPFTEAADHIEQQAARIAELEAEHEAGRFISRDSPNDTWERWVKACDVVQAALDKADNPATCVWRCVNPDARNKWYVPACREDTPYQNCMRDRTQDKCHSCSKPIEERDDD